MIRRMGGIRQYYELPVMSSGDKLAISNFEKAELLAETFKKIHSSDNLTEEVRQGRKIIYGEPPFIGGK